MPLRDQFDREGYVLVPGAFPPEKIKSIRERYLPMFLDAKTNGKSLHTVEDVAINDPEIRSMIEVGPLADALHDILGTPFLATPYSSVDYGRFVSFHKDTTGIEIDGFTAHRDPAFRVVTVGIYLQQHQRGGLDVVPRSQNEPDAYIEMRKQKNEQREALKNSPVRRALNRLSRGRLFDITRPFNTHPQAITPPMNLGDAIIFNVKTVHAGNRDPVPEGHKLAIFYKCGVKNQGSEAYTERVTSTNAYLQVPARAVSVAALNAKANGVEFR